MGYGRERGNMAIKKSIPEKIFGIFNTLFMILIMIIMLYPVWYCIVCSISRPSLLMSHRGLLLLPLGFNLASYKAIISYQSLWIGYANTIFYVIAGTALNIIMTTLAAYSLSRKNVMFATAVTFMITFTMFFGGGLIPSYLNIQRLGLLNNRLALLLPGAMSAYNFIIMRTSFKEVPESLEESARIDGAQDFTILFRIMIPLCKPVIAVMVLYYGVGHWNSWFGAMIYLRNRKLYPLQLVLREILITNSTMAELEFLSAQDDEVEPIAINVKYAIITVATLPILCIYPVLQKYFVKGVMIGAIKG